MRPIDNPKAEDTDWEQAMTVFMPRAHQRRGGGSEERLSFRCKVEAAIVTTKAEKEVANRVRG